MGKRAGVFTIGVVSEYVTRSRMEGAAADLLLENIEQLPAVLAQLQFARCLPAGTCPLESGHVRLKGDV
jgi:hypothetical protein